jgi:hypothetical protein
MRHAAVPPKFVGAIDTPANANMAEVQVDGTAEIMKHRSIG